MFGIFRWVYLGCWVSVTVHGLLVQPSEPSVDVLEELVKKATLPDLYEASVLELQYGLDAGLFTSVDLIKVGHVVFFFRG
jgi:amidase